MDRKAERGGPLGFMAKAPSSKTEHAGAHEAEPVSLRELMHYVRATIEMAMQEELRLPRALGRYIIP